MLTQIKLLLTLLHLKRNQSNKRKNFLILITTSLEVPWVGIETKVRNRN